MGKVVFLDSHIAGVNEYLLAMEKSIKDAGHSYVRGAMTSDAEVIGEVADADAIVTTYYPINKTIIDAAPNLKVILRNAIGYEIIDFDAANARRIPVCNIPDYCTEEVATHTFALLLACERKLKVSAKLVERGEWKIKCDYPIDRLSKQTLGMIGFGRIAKLVAGYARAFNMKVIAYDPFLPDEVFAAEGVASVTLEELYAQSDVISLNAPLTRENRHIINSESIAKMKDGVIIINTGRGPLVSTPDLVQALKSGKVKAAGLDVLDEEPLRNPDADILAFDNVILTAHIGYDSNQALADNYRKAGETVIAILGGELPYNILNRGVLN